jgi:signal transduction histidine kinase
VTNFIAILAHELRNPLAPIRNAVQLQKTAAPGDPVRETARQIIERQSGQLSRIVDDLLDISRVTHGLLTLHRERQDVVGAMRQAVQATEHLRRAARQSIHVDAPERPVWVDADSVRLEQIFGNLLVNASKFTNAGGNINVVVARLARSGAASAPCASIRIIDDGIGVNPIQVGRIFEMFVQGDAPSSSRANGMGLGLPLAKQLVELHGGSIGAKSDGEGKGLEIEILLPLLEDGAPTAAQ